MPTIITHPLVAFLKSWFPRVPRRAVAVGAVATILPDADVAAFAAGIPYHHPLGHRGFTHSIVFALIVAVVGTLLIRDRKHRRATFTFLFLCAMSHAVLDAMTDGGLGVAFFSPFSNERHFFPWTPIRVSPIGASFFSARGLATLFSEMRWVWLPVAVLTVIGRGVFKRERGPDLSPRA
ncbi:MAG TPA: metal-dependent hydrolase [Thermoanaerobaculia bacterium]|nr:metal-dependent hydrolase [Thermoanaerobaculia bacterium]